MSSFETIKSDFAERVRQEIEIIDQELEIASIKLRDLKTKHNEAMRLLNTIEPPKPKGPSRARGGFKQPILDQVMEHASDNGKDLTSLSVSDAIGISRQYASDALFKLNEQGLIRLDRLEGKGTKVYKAVANA